MVEVETGSVIDLEIIFVAWKVVVKAAPGEMEDLIWMRRIYLFLWILLQILL